MGGLDSTMVSAKGSLKWFPSRLLVPGPYNTRPLEMSVEWLTEASLFLLLWWLLQDPCLDNLNLPTVQEVPPKDGAHPSKGDLSQSLHHGLSEL